jgi:hypothetical protein
MTTNKNLFAPQKFQVIINRFPTVEFWAKSVDIPSATVEPVRIATGASVDFYQIGDKLNYSELTIEFFMDEDMKTYEEIYKWLVDAVQTPQPSMKVFDALTILFLTNNQNVNRKMVFHNTHPFEISPFMVDARSSEDEPITMKVSFRFSHFSINDVEINL